MQELISVGWDEMLCTVTVQFRYSYKLLKAYLMDIVFKCLMIETRQLSPKWSRRSHKYQILLMKLVSV